MHGLIRQGSKLRPKRCHHPSRQVQVSSVRCSKMLFYRDHLLLADKSVPAAERLRVFGRVRVVGGHILAHDGRRIASDIQAGFETIPAAACAPRTPRRSRPTDRLWLRSSGLPEGRNLYKPSSFTTSEIDGTRVSPSVVTNRKRKIDHVKKTKRGPRYRGSVNRAPASPVPRHLHHHLRGGLAKTL